jgi:hypothetical protein
MDSHSTVKSTDANNLDTTFFPDRPARFFRIDRKKAAKRELGTTL